ncbi:MAG: DUF6850 family outer membrane beta-barrel protein [Bacteroidia bacterium]
MIFPVLNRINCLMLGLLVIAITSRSPAKAQLKTDSLLAIAMGINANTWQLSANPIFLKGALIPNYAHVGISASLIAGDFKRPQDFKKQKSIGFGTNGLSTTGNWLFFGRFNYGKIFRDSIKYANVARPYDGNPFITGDAIGGNWRGDGLDAGLQVLLPNIKNWQAALKLDYATEQNSRDNDPKPLNRLLHYAIQPSVAYTFNNKHLLSLLAGYRVSDETIETGYYADQNPIIYSIRGYGEFSAGPVVTAQRFTKGYGFTVGVDYRYKSHGELLFSARFGYRTQDVNEGVAKPVFVGGFDERKGEAILGYQIDNNKNGWSVSAKGWFLDGTGFDPVFRSVNPAHYHSGISGKLSYWKKNASQRLIQMALYPGMSYTNYFESIAKTDWTSTMLHQEAGISMISHPAKKVTLAGELKMGYHFNFYQHLIINRPTLLSPILVTPHYQFATSNYLNGAFQFSATYQTANVGYQLAAHVEVQKAGHRSHRTFSNISLNLIF